MNKAQVQRQFDRSAIHYDRIATMQCTIVDELMPLIRPEHIRSKHIRSKHIQTEHQHALDLGCGTGYGMLQLAKCGVQHLTGLDIAPGMLDVAADKLPNARFIQGDIECLPMADQQFDLSLCSSALQWCQFERAVAEIVRVTKANGQILLATFIKGTLSDWRALWGLADHQPFIDLPTLRSVMSRAGVVVTHCWTQTYLQRFATFEDGVQSIRKLGAGNAHDYRSQGLMGRQQYSQIKQQVDHMIDRQGYLELPYKVAFVSATVSG